MKESLVNTLKESLLHIQKEEVDRYIKKHEAPSPISNRGVDAFRERIFLLMSKGLNKVMDHPDTYQLELLQPLCDYKGTIEQYRHSKNAPVSEHLLINHFPYHYEGVPI